VVWNFTSMLTPGLKVVVPILPFFTRKMYIVVLLPGGSVIGNFGFIKATYFPVAVAFH
jgi:hypothetical protein